jgi:hypothetical protein
METPEPDIKVHLDTSMKGFNVTTQKPKYTCITSVFWLSPLPYLLMMTNYNIRKEC